MYRIAVVIIIISIITSSLVLPYGSAFAEDNVGPNGSTQSVVQVNEPSKIDGQSHNVDSTQPGSIDEKEISQNDTSSVTPLIDDSSKTNELSASTLSSKSTAAGPETTPDLIITSFVVSSTVEYMELYNQSDNPYDLKAVSIRVTYSDKLCTLYTTSHKWILPKSFIVVSSPTSHTVAPIQFTSDCYFEGTIERMELFLGASRLQLIDGIMLNSAASWFRHRSTVKSNCAEATIPSSLKQAGSALADFVLCTSGPPSRSSATYEPPSQEALTITEVMSNSRSCTPSDPSDDCFDYIKVKNTGSDPVNLAELRLRTGSSSSSATISTSFHWMQPTLNPLRDEYLLEPGALLTIKTRDDGNPISVTNDEGNVWIEDYFGVKVYQSVHYSGMGLSAAQGKSWAFDIEDGTWKYGIPSPYGENTIPDLTVTGTPEPSTSSLKPCRDDQYRSEETNRCRSLVQTNTSTPCREGQYRNEETNRCRSIVAAAASVLKPCADDQFRNPETNRCRKIAGSEDLALVDCGEGRERNPETNRCRNIVRSAPAPADFAIEPIKEPASVFIGWWVLGGVALLIVGYAGWEWREEIARSIRKVTQFIKTGR